jgi:hypothetical protein
MNRDYGLQATSKIDGAGFKRVRLRLKLSAAALGRALGYEGSDANIARAIYRLETGRPIRKPIGRLLEMFDAYGVPLAWAGEVAQRKHSERPNWTGPRPASAAYDARHEVSRETTARFLATLKPLGPRHGPEVVSTVVPQPAPKAPLQNRSPNML